MATLKDYGELGGFLQLVCQYLEAGCTVDELKKVYHDAEIGLIDRNKTGVCFNECVIIKSIETIKNWLGVTNNDNLKVTTLINEWNEHVAPIFGVRCNTFDEFAIQAATVSSQWAKYKSAEAMSQQPVQPQQNQMFVDVNTLVSENNYLKSLNTSKDEEIKVLRERLIALGQPV